MLMPVRCPSSPDCTEDSFRIEPTSWSRFHGSSVISLLRSKGACEHGIMQAPGLNTPGPDGSYASAHSSEPGHHDCLDDWSRHVFLFVQLGCHAAPHCSPSAWTAHSN